MKKNNEPIEMLEYFTSILDGRIVGCELMKRQSENILNAYTKQDKYIFDTEKANRPIKFIENFCYAKPNIPLKLQLFQKARLQTLFGFVDEYGNRQYRECFIVEGRKNGKTTEVSAIADYMFIADGEFKPEIIFVANTLDQAKKLFDSLHTMLDLHPVTKKLVKKGTGNLINFPAMKGYVMARAANVHALDGLNPNMIVIDELHAFRNRRAYDLCKQAGTAIERKQSLFFCITTNGMVRGGIYDEQYDYAKKVIYGLAKDESFLPFIYELDDPDKELYNSEMWIKANPGLGTIKDFKTLEKNVVKTRHNQASKPSILAQDFNIPQTGEFSWLKFDVLNNEEKIPDHQFNYTIGGIDGADFYDLNAGVALLMRKGDPKIYVKSMFWVAQKRIDEMREKGETTSDNGAPYEQWLNDGYLRTYPGGKVDKKVFLDWFRELNVEEGIYSSYIGFDKWRIDESLRREFEYEIGQQNFIEVRQGAQTLSEPMKSLETEFRAKKIVYDNNPIMKWCLINLSAKTDINGNIQPVKCSDSRRRIDGAVALIIAYKVLLDKWNDYQAMIK